MKEGQTKSIIVSKEILYEGVFLPEEELKSLSSRQEVALKKVVYTRTTNAEVFKDVFANYDLSDKTKAIVFINPMGSRVDFPLAEQNNMMLNICQHMHPQRIKKIPVKNNSALCIFALG